MTSEPREPRDFFDNYRDAKTPRTAMQADTMNVTGMQCGGCVLKISLALNQVVGVDNVHASLASGAVTVVYDESRTSPQQLEEVVISTGFGVHGVAATNGHEARPNQCG